MKPTYSQHELKLEIKENGTKHYTCTNPYCKFELFRYTDGSLRVENDTPNIEHILGKVKKNNI